MKHILPTCLETPTSNAAGETLFCKLLEKGIDREREREIPWRIIIPFFCRINLHGLHGLHAKQVALLLLLTGQEDPNEKMDPDGDDDQSSQ